MYYRCSTVDHGEDVMFTDGGYYEKIVDGTPQLSSLGNYTGFKKSNTPEVCASQSPEASLFAAAHHGSPDTYVIYETDQQPDVDLSNEVFDFGLIEEVRYRNPSSTPVEMQRSHTIEVPEQAIVDINLSYLPPGPSIIDQWADAVKQMLRETLIHDDSYPDDITNHIDVERPVPEAYQDPYEAIPASIV